MGDPLSLAGDPREAVKQVARGMAAGGAFCGTVDNFYAALEHHLVQGLDSIEGFIETGTTQWLTHDRGERFPTRTFTSESLSAMLVRGGFKAPAMIGYTILPIRSCANLLETSEVRRRLIALEKKLAGNPSSLGSSAHIFFKTHV
jgi:hypothetical protein